MLVTRAKDRLTLEHVPSGIQGAATGQWKTLGLEFSDASSFIPLFLFFERKSMKGPSHPANKAFFDSGDIEPKMQHVRRVICVARGSVTTAILLY